MATRLTALTLFTLFYLGGAAALGLSSGNSEFLFYIVVMVVLILFVLLVNVHINMSLGMLWALSIWGFLHMVGGLLHAPQGFPHAGETSVLYNLWIIPEHLKYDNILHAYGFGLVTAICWRGLRVATRRPDLFPSTGILLICVAAGMGFGALNEVVEFAATLALPTTNVGGYINTGWDLVSNLVGCFVAAIVIRLYGPSRTAL